MNAVYPSILLVLSCVVAFLSGGCFTYNPEESTPRASPARPLSSEVSELVFPLLTEHDTWYAKSFRGEVPHPETRNY